MTVPLKEKEIGQLENIEYGQYDEYGFPIVSFSYGYDDEGYLVSDGQPMAEYDINRQQMTNTIESLKGWFGDRSAYVSGNNFLHYKKGDFTKHVSPDCYVVFGVFNEIRDNYKSWENDNHFPAIIFEFTSKKTKKQDEDYKFEIYEDYLKVPEYILFDPNGDYLTPPFQGWRLNSEGAYQPIPVENGRIHSEQLNMFMEIRDGDIRFTDTDTGEYLRTPYEAEQERRQEKARADDEMQARQECERIAAEALNATEEAVRIASEATRVRQEAEAQLAQIRAELEAARQGNS